MSVFSIISVIPLRKINFRSWRNFPIHSSRFPIILPNLRKQPATSIIDMREVWSSSSDDQGNMPPT
jgi:hypothetical protein